MAQDRRDMIPVASPLRRVFFRQTPRSLPLLREKQLAEAKAWAGFAPDREQPERRRVRRKIWRLPRFARLLERTGQSAGGDRRRANRVLLLEEESLGWACLF